MRRNEPITKIMTPAPATTHKGMKLSDVRHLMAEHHCHHIPVVDGKSLIGLVSSTDLLRVTYDLGQDPRNVDAQLDHTRSVAEVMQPELVTLPSTATVRDAAQVFSKNAFHSIPVVKDGDLVGIVTTGDLINYMLEQY